MPNHACSGCVKPSRSRAKFCPRCGRALASLTYRPAARAARSTSPAALAFGTAVSLTCAVVGVFLLVMMAGGGGVGLMFFGLVALSVGFAGVGATAASGMDTREPARPDATSPPPRSS